MSVIVAADLPDACTIYQVTRALGSGGAWPEARTERASGVPVRRAPAGARELEIAAHMGAQVTHSLYFLPGQAIERDDEVVIGATAYFVTAILVPSEEVYRKALVVERQMGA